MMVFKKNNSNQLNKIFLLVIIFSLLVYVILRAITLSFTHDESLTFRILLGDQRVADSANNHLMNTWLMYFFYKIFGVQEFFLRLPNILAFIVYSYFSYKILIKSRNLTLLLLGASLLLFNPYLLDFFSLARGYGLAMGFGLGALYFLLKNHNNVTYKQYLANLSLSLSFSLLSAYSSLFLINLNLVILMVFLIDLVLLARNNIIQLNLRRVAGIVAVSLLNLLVMSFLINHLLILRENNELYYGGQESFIKDTLLLLIRLSLYFSDYGMTVLMLISKVIMVIFFAGLIYLLSRRIYTPFFKITITLFLMVYGSILQHYLFEVVYPSARVALIFILMFGIFFYLFVSEIYISIINKRLTKILSQAVIVVFLCLPLIFHFLNRLNLTYTYEWKIDANTKAVMKDIAVQYRTGPFGNRKITISNDWIFEPSINFYRYKDKMNYLEPANRNGINSNTDFVYCVDDDKVSMPFLDSLVLLRSFEDTRTSLYKKTGPF